MNILLASASEIRLQLLRNAGLTVDARPARIDEVAIRSGMESEGAKPRDVADILAELKAAKISRKAPEMLVLGADQVLDFKGTILSKPESKEEARAQLRALSGQTHKLLSALVAMRDGQAIWRHVAEVRLTMHELSDGFLDAYLSRNWDSIRWSVGGYKVEEEGVRLFSKIEGDYFAVLGMPLIEFLNWLHARGELST